MLNKVLILIEKQITILVILVVDFTSQFHGSEHFGYNQISRQSKSLGCEYDDFEKSQPIQLIATREDLGIDLIENVQNQDHVEKARRLIKESSSEFVFGIVYPYSNGLEEYANKMCYYHIRNVIVALYRIFLICIEPAKLDLVATLVKLTV